MKLSRLTAGATLLVSLAVAAYVVASPASFTFTAPNPGWVPIAIASAPVGDPEGDTPGSRDIVGDASNPMLFVAADATHVYFRLRLDEAPLQSATNLRPFGWGCFIDTDADRTTYEFSTIVNGVTNPDEIAFFQNLTTTTANDPNDPPDLPAVSIVTDPLDPAVVHARESAASSMFGGDPDFFLEWAVDRSVVEAAGYIPGQPASFYCGSSNNGTTVAADCSGGMTASCPLDSQFSDPITCDASGCGGGVVNVCGDGTLSGAEACDDGNLTPGDGCDPACLLEIGEPCAAGASCVSAFCDAADGTCACDDDGDCPAAMTCNASLSPNACVAMIGCNDDGDCPAGVCDEAAGVCVGCVVHSDCPLGQVCDPSSQTCVGCVDDLDCSGNVCDEPAQTCVECLADGDCFTGKCDEPTKTCEPGCMADTDCDGELRCRVDSGQCVECLERADCVSRVCGGSYTCGVCTVDADCEAARSCDVSAGHCIQRIDGGGGGGGGGVAGEGVSPTGGSICSAPAGRATPDGLVLVGLGLAAAALGRRRR